MNVLSALRFFTFFVGLGLVHSLSFSSILPSFFNFLSLLILWFSITKLSTPKALISAAVFYIAHFFVSLSWLLVYANVFGEAGSVFSIFFLFALSFYSGFFYLCAVYLFKNISKLEILKSYQIHWAMIGLPIFWLMADYVRGYTFPYFPWVLTGYAYLPSDMFMQLTKISMLTPFVGVYGLGYIVYVLTGCGLAAATHVIINKREILEKNAVYSALAIGSILIFVSWLLYIFAVSDKNLQQPRLFTKQTHENISISLLREYTRPDEKFSQAGISDTEVLTSYEYYINLIKDVDADLLVMPETTMQIPWDQTPAPLKQSFINSIKANWLLLGSVMQQMTSNPDAVVDQNSVAHFANSAIALNKSISHDYQYDKIQRVPIAEFMPVGWGWFIEWIGIPYGSFEKGDVNQPPLIIKNNAIIATICYDFLFSNEIAARLRKVTTGSIMVNMSDMAWFGDDIVLDHVDRIIKTRSMEFEIPFVVASKTGPSNPLLPFVINDSKNMLRNYKKESFIENKNVPFYQGVTPYLRYGDLSVFFIVLAVTSMQFLVSLFLIRMNPKARRYMSSSVCL